MTFIIILAIYIATQIPTRQSCKPGNVFSFCKIVSLKVLPLKKLCCVALCCLSFTVVK